MVEDDKEEFTVEWPDEVTKQAQDDPKIAEALKEFGALAHQAMAGVESGQYRDFSTAMEALTGNRPKPVDPDEVE